MAEVDFPELDLQARQLPDGEWIVGRLDKPLREEEANHVVTGYAVLVRLIAQLKARQQGEWARDF